MNQSWIYMCSPSRSPLPPPSPPDPSGPVLSFSNRNSELLLSRRALTFFINCWKTLSVWSADGIAVPCCSGSTAASYILSATPSTQCDQWWGGSSKHTWLWMNCLCQNWTQYVNPHFAASSTSALIKLLHAQYKTTWIASHCISHGLESQQEWNGGKQNQSQKSRSQWTQKFTTILKKAVGQ